jgi:poly(3-hydroxybutyrate) depolymerase
VGFDYVYEAGFSGWADLVVLFPQAVSSDVNPNGCWDWWGYTGPAYASNIGVQMRAVWSIVQDLLSSSK